MTLPKDQPSDALSAATLGLDMDTRPGSALRICALRENMVDDHVVQRKGVLIKYVTSDVFDYFLHAAS